MFKLIRYFSIPSLLSVTLATVGLSFFYRQQFYQTLIKQQEQQNIAIAQLFANSIWYQHRAFLNSIVDLSYQEIVENPETLEIYQEIYQKAQGLSVVKLRIFDTQGQVIFSTELRQIKDRLNDEENQFLKPVIAGKMVNKTKKNHIFLSFGQKIQNRHILSSYLPIERHKNIEGVIELNCDITVALQRISENQKKILFIPIIVFGSLYLVFLQIVRYAERKLKEENMARLQAEKALDLKVKELARSNAELEQFAYVASHDLQEPLRKIETFGDRLKAKCGSDLSPRAMDYLERMQNSASRMRTLIQDLLAFSRVTTESKTFALVDLNLVVQDVVKDLEIRIKENKGRVEVGELPKIEAELVQMRQLFQNLISNALKFHKPDEPPVIGIQAKILPQTEDRENITAERYQITVTDNGIGFDEKYSDRIFKVFQRLHGRSEYEGTGIGLAICDKIVKRHGGGISVKSSPGQGTSFTIELPYNQATIASLDDSEGEKCLNVE